MSKFNMQKRSMLRILEEEQIAMIHENALDFLENTGVKLESDRALKLLEENGCTINWDSHMVCFPKSLVKKAIENAPETFDMYNSAGEKCIELGRGNSYFAPGPGSASIVNADGTKRDGTLEDQACETQIVQNSPYLNLVAGTIMPSDYQGALDLYILYQGMTKSSKPILAEAFSEKSLNKICKIIEMFGDGKEEFAKKPFFILSATPAPPLRWEEHIVDIAWKCTEYKIPLLICSSPIMGISAPVTIAGGILQHTIENLSFLTFVQTLCPGTPVFYGCICGTMDMRTTFNSVSSVEAALCTAGIAAMAQYYSIPTVAFFSQSDAKLPDYQAGFESCLGAMVSKMCGIDVIFGAGTLDGYGLTSKEKLAMDAQLFGCIQMFGAGVQVNEETLGKEEIEEVLCGEKETHIQREYTIDWFRESQFFGNSIIDRSSYSIWKGQGKDILERASEEIKKACDSPYQVDQELADKIELAFSVS